MSLRALLRSGGRQQVCIIISFSTHRPRVCSQLVSLSSTLQGQIAVLHRRASACLFLSAAVGISQSSGPQAELNELVNLSKAGSWMEGRAALGSDS